MIRTHVDALLQKLELAQDWPPKSELRVLEDLYIYAALREADGDVLKPDDWQDGRKYLVDNLASRIAEAKADLIYGEAPEVMAAKESNQTQLDDIVNENSLPTVLQEDGVQVSVSEGEVWWRVLVDKEVLDVPIIEFHSRSIVYPYYRGRQLLAVAFIRVIEEDRQAWRYVEVHGQGIVVNRLYEVPQASSDTSGKIGTTRIPQASMPGKPFGIETDLDERIETRGLPEEWVHDLGVMLAGRIRNKAPGRRKRVGRSDYAGVRDYLMSLNEAATIGHENMRLTAKKRAVIPRESLSVGVGANGEPNPQPPTFDATEEVFTVDSSDTELGSEKVGPFKVLEYSFDAEALSLWTDKLEDRILLRTRTAPQLVGKNTEGAQTGPALRARLMDSILDAQGKARPWDTEIPTKTLVAAQLVDNLSGEKGGFGRSWTDPAEAPSVKRRSILPEDEDARSLRLSTEVGGGLLSAETAIERNNPEWDEERVQEELKRIDNETGGSVPPPGGDE